MSGAERGPQPETEVSRQYAEGMCRMAELCGQAIWIHRGLKPLYATQALASLLGAVSTASDAVAAAIHAKTTAAMRLELTAQCGALLAGKPQTSPAQFNLQHTIGSETALQVQRQVLDWPGGPAIMETWRVEEPPTGASADTMVSLQWVQSVLDRLPSNIFIKDADHRFVLVNRSMARMYGATPQDLVGRTFEEVPKLSDSQRELFLATDRQVAATRQPVVNLERELTDADGRPVYWRLSKFPLFDPSGRHAGLVGLDDNVTEFRQTQEQLREKERLLQTVFDSIPHLVFVKTRENRYLMVNQAMSNYYGLPPEQIVGKTFGEISGEPADLLSNAWESDMMVLVNDQMQTIREHELTNAEGETHYFQTTKAPLFNASGDTIGLVGISSDISELKQTETQLRENRRLLQGVLDTMPNNLFVKDVDFRYILVNKALAEFYGRDPGEILGLNYRELSGTQREADDADASDTHILATRQPAENPDHHLVDAGGVEHQFHTTKHPLVDEDGAVVGIVGVSSDITERRHAEQQVRQSQRMLQTVLDTIPYHIFVKDAELRYRMVNQAMAQYFGRAPEDLVGRVYADIAYPGTDSVQQAAAADHSALTTGLPQEIPQHHIVGAAGVTRTFHSYKHPLYDEDGRWAGLVCISDDITERSQLEEQLRQSQKMEAVGQLAGGIAHDFNNMLQVVQGAIYVALQALEKDPKMVRKQLEHVERAAERAATLTRQLLAYGRRQVLQPRTLDTNETLREVLAMLDRVLGEQVETRLELDPHTPSISADPGMLQQALINLCINARDAMPAGGRLTLRTSAAQPDSGSGASDVRPARSTSETEPPRFACIEISDTGIGIPAEQMGHIFEPFYTTKQPGQGTGLGLSMVYGVIQQHEGEITVHSVPNAGTSIKLYLPAANATPEQAPTEAAAQIHGGTETLLVAEDEPMVLELVCSLLRSAGYTVLTARDGQEAVEVFQAHRSEIDLVILDVKMPRMAGRQAYILMHQERRGLPGLFLTGYSADVLDAEFLEQHGLQMLSKPLAPGALLAAVRTTLDRHAARGQSAVADPQSR